MLHSYKSVPSHNHSLSIVALYRYGVWCESKGYSYIYIYILFR